MKLLAKKIIYGCEASGTDQSPYLTRWTLIENRFGALYLHIFHRSDGIEMHDHPWNFWSLILWRGYVEESPVLEVGYPLGMRKRKRVWPGMILRRKAHWIHRVQLVAEKPAVTLVWRGKYRREWGILDPLRLAAMEGVLPGAWLLMIQCPDCQGKKQFYVHRKSGWRWAPCHLCNGTGEVDESTHERIMAGRALSDDRKARGLSLNEEAARLGITPRELGDKEWGRA